jgi:hypothetical protein
MANWKYVTAPSVCERVIGFSIPDEHEELLIISYEGMHTLKLGEDIVVSHDNNFQEYDLYDPDLGVASYKDRDWPIIGLMGGTPIHRSVHGEELRIDESKQRFTVRLDGKVIFKDTYKNFSGDWIAGTFSTDGNWLILGCPYDFDLIILRRSEIGEQNNSCEATGDNVSSLIRNLIRRCLRI